MGTSQSTRDATDEVHDATEDPSDSTEVDPSEITKTTEGTDGTFVRFERTVHPSSDGPGTEDTLSHRRFVIDNSDEHVHPRQEELIEVLSGQYGVSIEGTDRILTEGEGVTVPPDTPHRQWNPTDQPVRVAHEAHPARQSEGLFETLYVLAQAGQTDEKGIPNLLQFAVISHAYPGHVYVTTLPVSVQKALFTLLAPVDRLAGHKATYSREDVDALR